MSRALIERLQDHVAGEGLALPVFSDVAMRVQQLAQTPDWDAREVEALIASDPALAAEVLRAANSAFFGGLTPVHSVRAAVTRLGLAQVARIVLLVSGPSRLRLADRALRLTAGELWRHSIATAMAAHWLARRLGHAPQEDVAFLGGLLHDIGKLAIVAGLDAIAQDGAPPVGVELMHEVLDASHVALGVRLLERWRLPDAYVAIVRDHHREPLDTADVPLCLVRLANQAARKAGYHLAPDPALALTSTAEAEALDATEVVLAQLEIALEDGVAAVTGAV